MSKQDCIVVGAGPAGLMLGLLLARDGITVTVIGVGTRAVRNRTLRSNGAGTLCGTP